jgi:hypothetical protein
VADADGVLAVDHLVPVRPRTIPPAAQVDQVLQGCRLGCVEAAEDGRLLHRGDPGVGRIPPAGLE